MFKGLSGSGEEFNVDAAGLGSYIQSYVHDQEVLLA